MNKKPSVLKFSRTMGQRCAEIFRATTPHTSPRLWHHKTTKNAASRVTSLMQSGSRHKPEWRSYTAVVREEAEEVGIEAVAATPLVSHKSKTPVHIHCTANQVWTGRKSAVITALVLVTWKETVLHAGRQPKLRQPVVTFQVPLFYTSKPQSLNEHPCGVHGLNICVVLDSGLWTLDPGLQAQMGTVWVGVPMECVAREIIGALNKTEPKNWYMIDSGVLQKVGGTFSSSWWTGSNSGRSAGLRVGVSIWSTGIVTMGRIFNLRCASC